MRYLLLASIFVVTPAFAQEHVTLKPGPGLDAVTTSCSVCHTLNYIRMNSPFLTPNDWTAEVTKMRSALGAPIDDDTAKTIINYLSTNYAAAPKS